MCSAVCDPVACGGNNEIFTEWVNDGLQLTSEPVKREQKRKRGDRLSWRFHITPSLWGDTWYAAKVSRMTAVEISKAKLGEGCSGVGPQSILPSHIPPSSLCWRL